ncbi:MAG: cold shock domain-containing protein, partial [Pedobacter agri]
MYNSEKGFGFITPDSHSEDLFVHVTGLLVRELKS